MSTTYNERCTIVANPDATIKTIFVDRMGIDDAGRHYLIGQETIGNSELDQFIGGVLNQALADKAKLTTDLAAKTTAYDAEVAKVTNLTAEKATLTAEKTQLTSDLATANATISTLTADKTSLQSQADSFSSQLSAKTDELAETKAELQSQIDSLEAERIVLNTRIAFLESIRTYNPNVIKSEAFYDRITKDELFALGTLAVSDETAKGILELLGAYKANNWKVLLNDPQVVGAMQYLTALGTLVEGRVAQITRPATREEAYIEE